MKNIYIILIMAISAFGNIQNFKTFGDVKLYVDSQVEDIKKKRNVVSQRELNKIKNIFIFLKKKKVKDKKTKSFASNSCKMPIIPANITNNTNQKQIKTTNKIQTLKLYAIMNKSVLINGKWYKLGEKVYGYKIVKVTSKTVTLNRNGNVKTLTTNSKKSTK